MNKKYFFFTLFMSSFLGAAPQWNLNSYIHESQSSPEILLKRAPEVLGFQMNSQKMEELKNWQDRVAILLALAELYSPEFKNPQKKQLQEQAELFLRHSLVNDPALLVRDSAVEALRRIFRMAPREAGRWKKDLETAFFHSINEVQGNGLFIRETILTAMRESGIRPSRKLLIGVKKDKNPRVREKLELWNTSSF